MRLAVLACFVLACVAVPAAAGAGSPVGSADASTPPAPAHHEVKGDPTTIRTADGPVHGTAA
ncbi:MAG: hypothetical protein QOJ44_2155, partial [Acidimicrobiaceae bacterium]|nr:hypothetical protein [Acidimicrobiaceae bacterium]